MKNAIMFTLIMMLSRFIITLGPEWANFSPVGAFMFLAIHFYGWRGFLVSTLGLWLSDVMINEYMYSQYNISVFPGIHVALFALSSMIYQRSILLGSVISVWMYFVMSNFIVWTGNMYPHDLQGLTQCYINAIPFLKNALISQLLFIFVILKIKERLSEAVVMSLEA